MKIFIAYVIGAVIAAAIGFFVENEIADDKTIKVHYGRTALLWPVSLAGVLLYGCLGFLAYIQDGRTKD
jgi:hypothetical protein